MYEIDANSYAVVTELDYQCVRLSTDSMTREIDANSYAVGTELDYLSLRLSTDTKRRFIMEILLASY